MTTISGDQVIEMRQRLVGTPDKVFAWFADAGKLRNFIAPGAIVEDCAFEAASGGRLSCGFRIGVDDRPERIDAEVLEIVENEQIVMDWTSTQQRRTFGPTLVRIVFEPAGDEDTQIRVMHSRLERDEMTLARAAWTLRLDQLERLLAIEKVEQQAMSLRSAIVQMRRAMPPMNVPNITLRDAGGAPVKLSEAFGDRDEMLIVHNMGRGCPYCTLWADGMNGFADHLDNRAAFIVVSPDEPEVMREFAASRGWRFRMLSGAGTTFTRMMGFEPQPGRTWPGVSALRKYPDGSMRRVAYDHFGPGDPYCGVWPMLQLLDKGDNGWEPKYRY